ncbi:hypothetical protein I5I61_21590 [Pseudomonas nitroreducens]|uniref:Lipoprotein n=1 Tax=Pseudomonas nitroreducens TaxID=46680 RepID=A0ABS0KRN4_PSENT|nr:hypothetical protein [Pseudomonas nitroreducens]MBG6290057.1 hypothetical protein [Pseudomonas nitroreducens]
MKMIMIGVVLALVGCQSQQQAPAPEPRVVEVQVPVAVPCKITPVTRPAFAVDSLSLDAEIDEQMRALRAERKQRQGYEARLEAAVQGCQ